MKAEPDVLDLTAGLLAQVLEGLPIGVYVIDTDGRPVYANACSVELLGQGIAPDANARDLPRVYQAYLAGTDRLYPPERQPIVRALDGIRSSVDDMEVRRPDGTIRIEVWANPIRDASGSVIGAAAAFADISERKRVEHIKDAFLAAATHDMRTRVAAILGFAHLLDHEKTGSEQRARFLDRIQLSAKQLGRLLADLVDLDRFSGGAFEPRLERIDVAALLWKVVCNSGVQDEHEVSVACDELTLRTDPPMLERILENLLWNAAKYTPARTPVWVRAHRAGPSVVIAVEDSGPGVPADEREAIFMRARRGSSAGEISGSGIGLYVVARFAELLGGRAWVEDRDQGGASFRVELPDEPVGLV